MASRAARLKAERLEKQMQEEREREEKRIKLEEAKSKALEQEKVAAEKEEWRKLERAKDVFRQLFRKADKEDRYDSYFVWKGSWRREQKATEMEKVKAARERENTVMREREQELQQEHEEDLRKEKERQDTHAKEIGAPIEAQTREDLANERPPNDRDSGNRMWAVDNLLEPVIRSGIRNMHIQKVGKLCVNLQRMRYDKKDINAVVRALYLTQTEEDMKPAWLVFDVTGRGQVSSEEFQVALQTMGEDVPKDKIKRLFEEADSDGSGSIEFDEFLVMMRKFNPMPKSITSKTFNSTGGTVASVLDEDIQRRLHPLQKAKVGKIVQNMLKAKYAESQINAVVRALYMGQALCDPVWSEAWKVFDYDGGGSLDAKELRRALKLLGDSVSDARLDELFEMADEDGSGEIEFDEFVMLLRHMNPKPTTANIAKQMHRDATRKNADDASAPLPVATEFQEYLDKVGVADYTQEFLKAKLLDSNKIETMSLVHIGNVLGVSNAERNMIWNKVQAFVSRRELEKKITMMEVSVRTAKDKAFNAKAKAKMRQDTSRVAVFNNYRQFQEVAEQFIGPEDIPGAKAVFRPGQGIAAELAALRGDTSVAPIRSATDLKIPNPLRSPMKESEWNHLASPPRSPTKSPRSQKEGSRVGSPCGSLGSPLGSPMRLRATPQSQAYGATLQSPLSRSSCSSPARSKPSDWFVTDADWHRSKAPGPLIGPMTKHFKPGTPNRTRNSLSPHPLLPDVR